MHGNFRAKIPEAKAGACSTPAGSGFLKTDQKNAARNAQIRMCADKTKRWKIACLVKNVTRFSDKSFYLINKHMPYKSRTKGWKPWFRDLKVLYELYCQLDDSYPKIICGDFNAAHHSFYVEDGTRLFTEYFIGCRKPTTISYSYRKRIYQYAHEFNHFILNAAATDRVIQEPARYTSYVDESGNIRFGSKKITLEYFCNTLSDHVPIVMSFDF